MIKVIDARVIVVVAFLLENRDDMSVAQMSKLAGISERRLEEIFKAQTGVSIRAFLKCQRLHRAAALLEERNAAESIKTIQFDVGYAAPATFSHEFKRHFGMTPSEFRSGLRNNAAELWHSECVLSLVCPWARVIAFAHTFNLGEMRCR